MAWVRSDCKGKRQERQGVMRGRAEGEDVEMARERRAADRERGRGGFGGVRGPIYLRACSLS